MIDTEIIQQQIDGMISRGTELRKTEALFLKVQGIDETIINTQNERQLDEWALELEKENLKKLKSKKTKAVSAAAEKIESKMNEILPMKNAVFQATDGLIMGIREENGNILRYNSLSGAQEHEMNAALSNVLGANILVIEGAEIDHVRTAAMLEDLAGSDKQVLFNTCLPPRSDDWPNSYIVPDGFELIVLGD